MGQWRWRTAVQQAELDRERTWSDDTTHAIHESQTLRIERVHDTRAHETAWTVAAYETPVSDRMWVLTATGNPRSGAAGSAYPPRRRRLLGHRRRRPGGREDGHRSNQPLSDAGWKHTVDGRWIRWTSSDGAAGVHFDALDAVSFGESAEQITGRSRPSRHRVPQATSSGPTPAPLPPPAPRSRDAGETRNLEYPQMIPVLPEQKIRLFDRPGQRRRDAARSACRRRAATRAGRRRGAGTGRLRTADRGAWRVLSAFS